GVWWLFRHADCGAMLRDHAYFGNDTRRMKRPGPERPSSEATSPLISFLRNGVMGLDPPEHTRLRAVVKGAFKPRTVEELQPAIGGVAAGLPERVQGAGRMDLIADFSHPLAVGVIAELLGVPASDRELFGRWASAIAAALDVRKDEDGARLSRLGTEAAVEI